MKIVKLNRRFTIYRNHGFEVALRFEGYTPEARRYEKAVKSVLGSECWLWKWYNSANEKVKGDWASGWSNPTKSGDSRPYWLYLRKESSLSAVMLVVE